MSYLVPKQELHSRMDRFMRLMEEKQPDFTMVIIISKINMYYFTGTMQNGMLIILRNHEPILWVRKSYKRAKDESAFDNIKPMKSYRDAVSYYGSIPATAFLETNILTMDVNKRLQKSFGYSNVKSVQGYILYIRSIKSDYELDIMKISGKQHRRILDIRVPELLTEGISEAEFFAKLYPLMVEEGYQGVSRFSMFDTEVMLGQIGFGTNSYYPAYFNGPGGQKGRSAAIPILGDANRRLRKGDLVFADIGAGHKGYHTDCTKTYVYNGSLPDYAVESHIRCRDIQLKMADMLRPGVKPSEIYEAVYTELDAEFIKGFMGVESVKFLGHGIGLTVDETPVIAPRFDMPLEANMTIALEPKRAIEGIGTVGVEDTFVVTAKGGISLTGSDPGLQRID